jgi:hypothetical protein
MRTRLQVEDDMWQWKAGALFVAVYLLAAAPALAETSREAAEVVAARHARTCYVEMMDGQLKCRGRPRRSLAAARALLGPGTLAKPDEPSTCKSGKPTWIFKWRGFPDQAPIGVDVATGKLIECRS